MLSTLVRLFKVDDCIQSIRRSPVDLIVPISYTTTRKHLVRATHLNLKRAIHFRRFCFKDANIAFSSCSYPFIGADSRENDFRMGICQKYGIVPIIAKSMVNTVDEAMNIRDELVSRGIKPKCILICTGELHSSSAYYIWSKLFKGSEVLVTCSTPYMNEVQPDHPVFDQRIMSRWVLSNIKRQIALHILPLAWVRKYQHKAVE